MRLTDEQIDRHLSALDGWQLAKDKCSIWQDFSFSDFYQTMAFVNAVAWIAHSQDHHPQMEIGYRHCLVSYCTHSLGGLGEKDFICAKRIDALLTEY